MEAKKLIYNLRTVLESSGTEIVDYTDQHLMYMLDEARSTLAKQKLDRGVSLNHMVQFLDVTPKKASAAQDLGIVGSANVVKVEVPRPVSYMQGEAIFTVGAKDGADSFTRITFSQLRTVFFRKYTSKTPKWLWHNDAIYIVNIELDSLKSVRVRGIFNEPYLVEIAAGRYKYLTPFEFEYPATLEEAKILYQLAISSDLGWGDSASRIIANEERKQQKEQQYLAANAAKNSS